MPLSSKKTVALILLMAILGTMFLPQVSSRLKTLSAVINLLIPAGNWRPLQLFTKAPSKELKTITSASGRTLDIHIYTPRRKADTAMIIYTPFIGDGSEDLRLVNLAQTFARSGFIVATPFRKEEPLTVNTKDINDIVSTVLFLKNESGLKINRVGFFGISYGNGPAFAASIDPQIKNLVRFIVSFGGFYDLGNALHFIRTGEFSYKDISGSLEPHPYAKEILSNTIASYNMNEGQFLESGVLTELIKKLSPSKMTKQLSADLFIVHSIDDRYIPYTESMRFRDAFQDRVPTVFALTTAFEHGAYKSLTFENFRRHYLPSFTNFYTLLHNLLSKYQSQN